MNAETKPSQASISLNRLIAFLVAGGFLFLLIETRIEHDEVLKKHLPAYVPMLFSAVGFVLALVTGFSWKERWIRVLHVYLFIVLLVGLGGIYFHNAERVFGEEDHETAAVQRIGAEHEENEEESHTPLLAPLAFTGLGVVGLLGTYRRWRAEVIEKEA